MNELVHKIAGTIYAQVYDWWREKPDYAEDEDTGLIRIAWTYQYHAKGNNRTGGGWHGSCGYHVAFYDGYCELIGPGRHRYEYADQRFPENLLTDLAEARGDK